MQSPVETRGCGRFYRASWVTLLLTLGFGGSLAVAREWFGQGIVPPGIYSWLLALAPIALGVLLLRAYAGFINALDELWIKIYLRALAFSFGVCVLGLLSYPILELANAPGMDPFIYGGLCVFVFGGALFYNARKYT
jgi:hypothetical protein